MNEKVDEPERISLLSGLVKCPVCGSGMIATKNKHVNKNKGGYYKTIIGKGFKTASEKIAGIRNAEKEVGNGTGQFRCV